MEPVLRQCSRDGSQSRFHTYEKEGLMTEKTTQDWNPRDPSVLADQRQAYDDMRERCPVAHSGAMQWALFRHADVLHVLDDPDTFINSSRHMAIPNAMNGDEHTEHRELLSRFFAPERMAEVEPMARNIAARSLGALDRSDTIDGVTDIAEPVALQTMCAFLGWPPETWERVRDWIHGNRDATFRRDRDASRKLAAEYAEMVRSAIADHRQRNITDDVTGQLMNIEIDGQRWTDNEIIATLRNWIAGHGTVASAIGIVIAHLAGDQELQQRLRDDPSLIPAAIEEIPRVDGPLVANTRTTTREITLDGRVIPEGRRVSLMWIAANRDPDVFDDPSEVRLDRDQQENLLYGHGIHYCLGAPLSRLELSIAIETLLASTHRFSLASSEQLERETLPGNGLVSLPLRLE